MQPEPRHRSQRHRSASRPRQRDRSPSLEPSRRRQHQDAHPSNSPTQERSERSRERFRQDTHQRAKSRPPGSGRGSRDSRGKTTCSIKRPRVRFNMIDAEGAAETLTAKATQSGFLRKQADNEPGAWNEYYFVIKPLTYLMYYNTKDDETPRGIIDLEYLTDIKRNADCLQRAVAGGDNCFRVSGKLPRPSAEQTAAGDIPKMRPLYLDTDNADEAEKWMNAIRNHRFSVKKDEQFFETVHQLRDAEFRVAQLEEEQQKETETKKNLRIKAKTLLLKMRAVDSGNTDEIPEVDVDNLDDVADDMLAMLEGMEDVLVNLHTKLDQQKQEKKADTTGPTITRRGFAQVIQRAVSRRENTSFLDLSEDDEEETLAAIRSRRQHKPQPPVIQEQPKEKPQEKIQEPPREKPKKKPKETPKEKIQEEVPAMDNVSDVLAMWKAKKKKKDPSSRKHSAPEDGDGDDSRRNRAVPRSQRTTTPDTAKYKKSRGSDRSSEEDTVSLDSSDDCDSREKLPPGWTKHESRGYPGTYYYAHESGKVSWDVPTDNTVDSGRDYMSEYETDGEETAGGTTSAAYRKKKPKPKSAWAFKLPKLLPTNTTQAVPTEAAASLSPIRRGANHHEF
ncbi:uncharacterized protein PITG_10912 [Phytophthora infestans T30-4]|uniref:WW domain-containing protein n=1 Tax=Phytophthora infestans (strain T30-4) TaxID=403677 RepID=D0NHD6_PHYIT|nr:uncharacterized protein PITG_10912 [Phytophthora infestans T30-4]EEY58775.1 conserved hypothetical protein [Phytophthora infestans T30-4]|eukprot:XP_002901719.1 conserved hypothetical protein [Phytophthora infestans T30-4]